MTGLGRRWDEFDAYLFDIDGTLLSCADAIHYDCFCKLLEEISGWPSTLEGVTAHGNTDVGILRDALLLRGVPDEAWRPRLLDIQDTLCGLVEVRVSEIRANPLPRVREVLEYLRSRGAVLGTATGNLSRIGRIKLQRAGLLGYFHFAAGSDGYEYRVDVVRAAVRAVKDRCGASSAICLIGDTPADIHAAHRNGLKAIAVATGIYPHSALLEAGPDLCIYTLVDLPISE